MSFGAYNKDWVEAVCFRQKYVREVGAIEKINDFLMKNKAEGEPYLSTPLIFDLKDLDRLAVAGRALLSAQGKILSHLEETVSRAGIIEIFDVPEMIVPYVDWENLVTGKNLITRFDIVPSSQGYHFCEINCDSTVAGFELFECAKIYADALSWPLMTGVGARAPHGDILLLINRMVDAVGFDRILVCDWSTYRDTDWFGFDFLYRALKDGLPDIDVRLAYEDDYPQDWLQPGTGSKTLVYRGFMHADMVDGGAFYGLIHGSGATIINSFETEIRSSKRWFAMFHDSNNHALLSVDEIYAIDQFVPRTVAFDELNILSILNNKDDYVFKINNSSGGKGVLIGEDHTTSELKALLAARGVENWTAQELIESEILHLPNDDDFVTSPHRVVLGMFLIDGQASGLNVRASRHSRIVNVSLGVASCLWAVPMLSEARRAHLAKVLSPRQLLPAVYRGPGQ
jgi:hypothetical protein